MSPEQANGKETNRSTDVWALGCVFYEIFCGRRVFEGVTLAEILGGVMKAEPNWNRLPDGTPAVQRLLRRCLRKDEKLRLRDARDAWIEIHDTNPESEIVERSSIPLPSRLRGETGLDCGTCLCL